MIVDISQSYKIGQSIPRVKYVPSEVETWGNVYAKLKDMTKLYASKQYNYIMSAMESNCGYSENNIPQLQDISDYLKACTGTCDCALFAVVVVVLGVMLCVFLHGCRFPVEASGRLAVCARFFERPCLPSLLFNTGSLVCCISLRFCIRCSCLVVWLSG